MTFDFLWSFIKFIHSSKDETFWTNKFSEYGCGGAPLNFSRILLCEESCNIFSAGSGHEIFAWREQFCFRCCCLRSGAAVQNLRNFVEFFDSTKYSRLHKNLLFVVFGGRPYTLQSFGEKVIFRVLWKCWWICSISGSCLVASIASFSCKSFEIESQTWFSDRYADAIENHIMRFTASFSSCGLFTPYSQKFWFRAWVKWEKSTSHAPHLENQFLKAEMIPFHNRLWLFGEPTPVLSLASIVYNWFR